MKQKNFFLFILTLFILWCLVCRRWKDAHSHYATDTKWLEISRDAADSAQFPQVVQQYGPYLRHLAIELRNLDLLDVVIKYCRRLKSLDLSFFLFHYPRNEQAFKLDELFLKNSDLKRLKIVGMWDHFPFARVEKSLPQLTELLVSGNMLSNPHLILVRS